MTSRDTVQQFEVLLEPEKKGGYHVFCPALKGCHSYGETRQESLQHIAEAIALWVESSRELGIPVPDRETVTVKVA